MSTALRIFRSLLKPRLLVYPVLAIMAATVGTLTFMRSQWGNELLKLAAERLTPETLPNARLKIGTLETDILTGIALTDVSLRVQGTEHPAITVDSLSIDWDIPLLLSENKLRSFIYISGVRLNAREERGELNLVQLFDTGLSSAPDTETAWPELPIDLELAVVDLDDVKLRWEEAEITTEVEAALYWNEGENVDLQLAYIRAHMPALGDLASRIAVSGNSQQIDLDISLQQENRGITMQGRIEDVIGEGRLAIESNIHCAAACLMDFTEQNIPQVDQEIQLMLGGDLSTLIADVAIGETGGFPLQVQIIPAEEKWQASWKWNAFRVNDWVGELEPITLNGEYLLEGSGFSYGENMEALLQGTAPAQDIWNEHLEAWTLQLALKKETVEIEQFLVAHSMGTVGISGDLNLLESQGTLRTKLNIDNLTYLEKFGVQNIRGKIGGQPITKLSWKEEPAVQLSGAVTLQDMQTDFGSFRNLETQLRGDIDAEQAVLRLTHEIRELDASGVTIPRLELGTDIQAEFSGETRVDGQIYSQETKIEDGMVVLHALQGKFVTVLTEDLFFETQEMNVGGVELAPIQYKIDGGPISIQLKENNLIADLHLLRKEKTFIDVQAKSDLSSGTWWLDRLKISPTEGKEWGISEGIVFQLSDKGVQDFKLSLLSNEGEVAIFADTGNNSPDFSVEVKDVKVEYVLEVAELFGGVEGIPTGTSGLIQAAITVRGEEGKFGADDYLMLQNVYAPGLAENIDVVLDIRGKLERPRLKLVASSAKTKDELVRFNGYWPLNLENGFAVNCQEYGNLQLFFSETNWKKWQPYFPQTPEIDAYLGMQMRVKGKACQPSIQLSGVARLPIGAQETNLRADWQAIFAHGELDFSATIEERLQPIFIAEGHVETDVEEALYTFLETTVWEEPDELISAGAVMIRPQDLNLERVLPLIGLDEVMSGKIAGEINLVGNLSSVEGGGQLLLEDGTIGKEPIQKFELGIELDKTLAHVTVDSLIGTNGEIDIQAMVPFEQEEELDVSGSITALPFSIVEAFVPDIENAKGEIYSSKDITVRGTMDRPLVDLTIEGRDISFQHQDLGTKYQNLGMKAEITRNQLHLHNLAGEVASIQSFNPLLEDEWGRFEVRGSIATGETLRSRWDVTFDDCPLIDNQMAHLVVSGEMKAVQKENVFFEGNLFVHKGRLQLGKDFFTDSASLDLHPRLKIHRMGAIKKETVDSLEWVTDIMNEMEGDVHIDLGDRIAIKAELPMAEEYGQSLAKLSSVKVETDLRGKINAGWRGGEPQVTGTISTIRGDFETMGKSFDIEEGEVVFSGGQVYNPQLNLTAQKGFGSYGDIIVRVGGTVEEMKIDFESENAPETYDQTDILSLILLGKPAREMADSESQTSSVLLTAGLKTMGGMVGGAIGGNVVDEIDWDPSEGMFQIGKSVNDSMFLSYTQVKEPDDGGNENEITLEWLILNRIYMEFITGDANNSQVTLYYRWIF